MYARSNGAFISINCSSGKPLCKYLLFRPQLSSKRHLLDYLVNHYFVQMGNSGVSGTNLALTSDPPVGDRRRRAATTRCDDDELRRNP